MAVRVKLQLWRDSWQNLFECLHAKGTKINSKGNFWAAVQELERQFDPNMGFLPKGDKVDKLTAEEKH